MEFYQELRKIQKKERNSTTLAKVDETFYQDIHKYLADLRETVGHDFFAPEYNLIKDIQRVATEICQRREHKITDAAVVNIHRSYHLFTGTPKFDLVDTTPLNLTPEEERFYFSLIDSLKDHRNNISISDFTEDIEEEKPKEKPLLEIEKPKVEKKKPNPKKDSKDSEKINDKNLEHLDKVSKAKVIKDEKLESIEQQIRKQEDEEFKAIYGSNDQLESRPLNKNAQNVTLLVFDNAGPIVGVDEKNYGPFYPQDLVVIPKINAMVFVKNRKGRILKI